MPPAENSRPAFPHNPLYLADVSGPDVPGAALPTELAPADALHLWRVLRLVLAHAAGVDLPAGTARALRKELRQPDGPSAAVRPALGRILRELARGDAADARRLAPACLDVCDWALLRGAHGTALAWAEAAARAWPANARFAWVAGKLFRALGRDSEAKLWLRRALRLAVWHRDAEAQARALISFGNLYLHQGSYPRARRLLERALRIARRHRIREPEAMALHDLFMVAYAMERFEEAEKIGALALEAYGKNHRRLPQLAHDIAYYWLCRGYFRRALSVLTRLLPYFVAPADRLRVLASALRCAGACGEADLFNALWPEAWELSLRLEQERTRACLLLDMGYGASSLSDWHRADELVRLALAFAKIHGESDVMIQAEEALLRIGNGESAETAHARSVERTDTTHRFTEDLIRALTPEATRNGGHGVPPAYSTS